MNLADYCAVLWTLFAIGNQSSAASASVTQTAAAVIACITKMVADEETQDSIIEELNAYQEQQGAQ